MRGIDKAREVLIEIEEGELTAVEVSRASGIPLYQISKLLNDGGAISLENISLQNGDKFEKYYDDQMDEILKTLENSKYGSDLKTFEKNIQLMANQVFKKSGQSKPLSKDQQIQLNLLKTIVKDGLSDPDAIARYKVHYVDQLRIRNKEPL